MNMDFTIKTLGECKIKSPLHLSKVKVDGIYDFVEDGERENRVIVVLDTTIY
ncbi:MAG: hypothetical protein MJZ02_04540 [Paludibacteraceae bacterium]|nr:hypothetical protein [Paludibacteraceae bacterium]